MGVSPWGIPGYTPSRGAQEKGKQSAKRENAMSAVKLTIDGRDVAVAAGGSILDAAKAAGIRIPTLCHHERLNPIGSCNLCVVEVNGKSAPVLACKTPAEDGMVVTTSSDMLRNMRHKAMQRLLVHHPLDCPICDKAGDCRLQDLVFELGVTAESYEAPKERTEVVYATPLIKYWRDRCVLCQRCAAACREIKGRGAIDFVEVNGSLEMKVNPERCVSCGECLQVCPTGALTENLSPLKARVFTTRKVPTTCTYCGCGCQVELNVLDNRIVAVNGADDPTVNASSLCVKGRFGYEFVSSEERLKKPLIRRGESFVEASWDEALDYVAKNLSRIKAEHGPDAIGGFASARCTNEENYLFQKFMRAVIGTNNVDHCARL